MTHMYFSARTEGIRTFRHALRAACRTAISAAQILVSITIDAAAVAVAFNFYLTDDFIDIRGGGIL